MNFDFLTVLTLLAVFSGVVALVDWVFTRKKRKLAKKAKTEFRDSVLVDYARSFFPIFFLVLLFRAFLFQPFRVPTGSLEPTVMPGDFIVVSEFSYGLRLPMWHKKVFPIGFPHRGDVALFHWPVNPNVHFVKRVIGVPGDRISYHDKQFTINGQLMKQTFVRDAIDYEGDRITPVKVYDEQLSGKHHLLYRRPDVKGVNFKDLIVPPGMYFMVGDNRDGSSDSRYWGFVSDHLLVGRAVMIWMNWNWNSRKHGIQLDRLGIRL